MRKRWAPILVLGALLAACTPVGSPSPSADGSQPASSSPAASESADFVCTLPINGVATVPVAHLTDVGVGNQAGSDRVAFTFDEGTPEFSVEAASPPYLADASGQPIDVTGSRVLKITFNGGTKLQDDGSLSYEGPTNIPTELPVVVHLVEGGDFEAVNTWYLGLASAADPCIRVQLTTGPNAIVFEFQTPTTSY